jgi:hypothetical protein
MAMSCRRVFPQHRGWRCNGWDGRTGLMVTAGMRPTSRHGLVRAWNKRSSYFEGSAVLFRGCGIPAIREWVAQRHGPDAGHATQRRTVVGMASPGELAEQRRGVIPRRVRGVAWIRL